MSILQEGNELGVIAIQNSRIVWVQMPSILSFGPKKSHPS
jgi:hypothetical protein